MSTNWDFARIRPTGYVPKTDKTNSSSSVKVINAPAAVKRYTFANTAIRAVSTEPIAHQQYVQISPVANVISTNWNIDEDQSVLHERNYAQWKSLLRGVSQLRRKGYSYFRADHAKHGYVLRYSKYPQQPATPTGFSMRTAKMVAMFILMICLLVVIL